MTITITGNRTIGMVNTGTIANVGTRSADLGAAALAGIQTFLGPPRRTVVVGDVHGDYTGLAGLLGKLGLISDFTGGRIDGGPNSARVIQVGDLIHGGENATGSDDTATMLLAPHWFDEIVIGNHDAPHLYPDARLPVFAGMQAHQSPAFSRALQTLRESGRLTVATSHERWLITHAGLHPCYLRGLVEQECWGDVVAIRDGLRAIWARRVETNAPAPVFDAVGRRRGGPFWETAPGGALWCDWEELTADREGPGRLTVPQIVGHTPQRTGDTYAPTYHLGLDSWCVDCGAALSGVVGCIVQDEPGGPWRPVTHTRGEDGTAE